jgi:hypothetical protein
LLRTGNERKAKQLVLLEVKACNLYNQKHLNSRTRHSSFAKICPKRCVLEGSDTQDVCMCIYKHNAKLRLQAAGSKVDYKLLLAMTVCNIQAEDCMLDYCILSPRAAQVWNFLETRNIVYTCV